MKLKDTVDPDKTWSNNRGRLLLERDIEDYGRKKFKEKGWMFEKFTSPQKRSVPDDLCGVNGMAFFIEFKRPGKKATEQQAQDHLKRRQYGFMVFVVDCYEQLDFVVEVAEVCSMTKEIYSPRELPYWILT